MVVINKQAIEQFRYRKLDNHDWAKALSEADLDRLLAEQGAVWHTKPFLHQKACLLLGLHKRAFYFLLDMGAGKGHPVGTKILTSGGWRKIEELQIGDFVFGRDGKPKRILGVHKRGTLPVFRVHFSDRTSVLCDGSHIWLVQYYQDRFRHGPRSCWQEMTVEELLSAGIVEEGQKSKQKKFYIPLSKPIQFPKKDLEIDPYLLGVLIADGSFSKTITYSCGDDLVPAQVEKVLPPNVKQKLYKRRSQHECGAWGFSSITRKWGKKNQLSNFVLVEGMQGNSSSEKRIPNRYLYSSVEDRVSLLQGLMDCDGEIRANEKSGILCYGTTSKLLCEQFVFLIQSLGGTATVKLKSSWFTYKGARKEGLLFYRVTFRLSNSICPFRAHADRFRKKRKYHPVRMISKIEPEGEGSVICLSVEDGLYLTESCIVTHNSKLTLDIFQTRKKRGEVKRGLILVPGISNIGAWLEEIEMHTPSLTAVGLSDPKREKRLELLHGQSDLVIATYAGWISLLGMRKVKKGSKSAIEPWQRERIERMFQMVIWDEISVLKNQQTKFYRSALRLANRVPYRYALSGTPFHKNPEDLWSQFHVLDFGESLGETLTLFRSAFCKTKFNPFSKGFDYKFDKRKLSELTARLRHTSIRYSGEECNDLPPTVGGLVSKKFMCRPVVFPRENEEYYKSVIKELQGTGGNSALIKNVYIRLRQLTSGFIPIRENGLRVNLRFAQNPKLDAALDLLHEIPEDRKVLLFNEFRTSGEFICERLNAEKISHLRLYSGTKDKIGTLKQFKEDPNVRVLVASRSICYGVNLQMANYLIIYESPDSTILRTQLERRIVRYGQKEHTYIYDITMRDSVDVKILHYLRLGKNLFDVLIDSKDPAEIMAT